MVRRRRVPIAASVFVVILGPSFGLGAVSLARPCGPVALIVVKLCKSGLSSVSEGTGIAAKRLGSLAATKNSVTPAKAGADDRKGPGLSTEQVRGLKAHGKTQH